MIGDWAFGRAAQRFNEQTNMSKQIAIAFSFASSSNPNKTYQTLQYVDGTLSCDCPGWTRRVQPDGTRACRHTREVEFGSARHTAKNVVEYAPGVAVRRPVLVQAHEPAPRFTQTVFAESRGRVVDLETEAA